MHQAIARSFARALILWVLVAPQCAATELPIFVGGDWALINIPAEPRASLVLLPGGDGILDIQSDGTFLRLAGNQVVRTRKSYLAYGIATLTVDSEVDVAAAVTHMRKLASPVVVVATSRGSLKVAKALSGKPDAMVLTSAYLSELREEIGEPALLPRTLVLHHRHDGCWATPPSSVAPFQVWGGQNVIVEWMDGGIHDGDPCQSHGTHGFNGLDEKVVELIAKFALSLRPQPKTAIS